MYSGLHSSCSRSATVAIMLGKRFVHFADGHLRETAPTLESSRQWQYFGAAHG